MQEFEDYYEVLGIEQGSTLPQIRTAYRRVALKYHPDKFRDDPERAAEMFRKLTAISDLLSDPAKREQYDRTYTARKNAQKRFEALDNDIRQKRVELELREQASFNDKLGAKYTSRKQRTEKIMKIRAENKARMMEEAEKFNVHIKSIFHTANVSEMSTRKSD